MIIYLFTKKRRVLGIAINKNNKTLMILGGCEKMLVKYVKGQDELNFYV